MILCTAQRVRSARGLSGVNAFRRELGGPERQYIEVPPGGNLVRSYLDVEAPDGTPIERVLLFVEAIASGPAVEKLPLTAAESGIRIEFCCEQALAATWRDELRELAVALARPTSVYTPISAR